MHPGRKVNYESIDQYRRHELDRPPAGVDTACDWAVSFAGGVEQDTQHKPLPFPCFTFRDFDRAGFFRLPLGHGAVRRKRASPRDVQQRPAPRQIFPKLQSPIFYRVFLLFFIIILKFRQINIFFL